MVEKEKEKWRKGYYSVISLVLRIFYYILYNSMSCAGQMSAESQGAWGGAQPREWREKKRSRPGASKGRLNNNELRRVLSCDCELLVLPSFFPFSFARVHGTLSP